MKSNTNRYRNWKWCKNGNSETTTTYVSLWCSEIWQPSQNSSPGLGQPKIPDMICGSLLLPPCWADLCGVLSSPSLRHQPGHPHNTSYAWTFCRETHSSAQHDCLWFYQWSNTFLLDHTLLCMVQLWTHVAVCVVGVILYPWLWWIYDPSHNHIWEQSKQRKFLNI